MSAKAKSNAESQDNGNEEEEEEQQDDFPELSSPPVAKNEPEKPKAAPASTKPATNTVSKSLSASNNSPTIIGKSGAAKKGIGATKVSNDFFSDWNLDEPEPEEEKPQKIQSPKEEERLVYVVQFSISHYFVQKTSLFLTFCIFRRRRQWSQVFYLKYNLL